MDRRDAKYYDACAWPILCVRFGGDGGFLGWRRHYQGKKDDVISRSKSECHAIKIMRCNEQLTFHFHYIIYFSNPCLFSFCLSVLSG